MLTVTNVLSVVYSSTVEEDVEEVALQVYQYRHLKNRSVKFMSGPKIRPVQSTGLVRFHRVSVFLSLFLSLSTPMQNTLMSCTLLEKALCTINRQ